jgi:hypothetical protein
VLLPLAFIAYLYISYGKDAGARPAEQSAEAAL